MHNLVINLARSSSNNRFKFFNRCVSVNRFTSLIRHFNLFISNGGVYGLLFIDSSSWNVNIFSNRFLFELSGQSNWFFINSSSRSLLNVQRNVLSLVNRLNNILSVHIISRNLYSSSSVKILCLNISLNGLQISSNFRRILNLNFFPYSF